MENQQARAATRGKVALVTMTLQMLSRGNQMFVMVDVELPATVAHMTSQNEATSQHFFTQKL